jgi:hypothetical protein
MSKKDLRQRAFALVFRKAGFGIRILDSIFWTRIRNFRTLY